MPEIRQNIATKEWVIIATERAKRPEEFIQPDKERVEDRPVYVPTCPFCPGNEELDLERLRIPREGEWLARVVHNKFPALQELGARVRQSDGFNQSISGVGYHEVVVESRLHNTCPALEDIEEIARTLLAFQLRGAAIAADARIEQLIYFKNHGPTAGTSLLHPHTQIIGLPVVPSNIRARNEEARRYFDDQGTCVICRMLDSEERDSARMVLANNSFGAFIPFAAFSPFHLWIVPRRHASSFLTITDEEIQDLSLVLREILRKLYFGLNDPDYNYVIRSAPEHEGATEYLHWYIAIIPRVTRTAGFEMGSGMFINTALPEASATFLRGITPPNEPRAES